MEKKEIAATVKYAGAFIAWLIGSGFSTGQEILQFFSSYGIKSFLILLVNFIGSVAMGIILVVNGFDNRDNIGFAHFEYYCGKPVGKLYYYTVSGTLVLIISVLISAAGATFEQYYSLNRYIGSAVMASLILIVYLIGFERMVRVVSLASPVVIVFTVFVGLYSVVKGLSSETSLTAQAVCLKDFRAAPHWSISPFLYLSLNFLSGSIYYTELGRSAVSRRAVKWGAILGAAALFVTIGALSTAILINGRAIAALSVPTLYLAGNVSGFFSTVFSVVLIIGMFASCSTMTWSFCSRFFRYNVKKNKIFACFTVVGCMLLGFIPFGRLVSVVYPIIGYIGLFFVFGVLYNPFKKLFKRGKLNEKC